MTDTDIKTGRDLHEKLPDERYPFDFQYVNFKDSEIITSVDSVTQTRRGTVTPSLDMTVTNITHDNLQTGQAWFDGGTDGEHYCLTMQVTTSLGATRTCTGVLLVKEPC